MNCLPVSYPRWAIRIATASLVFLFWGCRSSDALVTLSESSTQLAFDSVVDIANGKLLAAGVLFRGKFEDLTLEGVADTDCYAAIADFGGFERTLLESPQMCLGLELFPTPTNDDTFLPWAVMSGISGNQAVVFTADFYSQTVLLSDTFYLPSGYLPIDLATDGDGGVFVAMHDTVGVSLSDAELENEQLSNIYNYYYELSYPDASGHDDSPQVVRMHVESGTTTWQVSLNTTDGRSTIASIAYLASRDLLVIAGSSDGYGSYVGAGVHTNSWDGFVTLIQASTGVIDDSQWKDNSQSAGSADHSVRITSQVEEDDYVLGMCSYDDNIYVVGTTTGIMKTGSSAGGGFVQKLDVDTLNVLWTQQWDGAGVEPTRCDATADFLYVSGHVPAGVTLDDPTHTTVGTTQDIFVSLLDSSDGSIQWTRQIDSLRKDVLANALYSPMGYVVLVGNAMNEAKGENIVYTITIEHTSGDHEWQNLDEGEDPIGSVSTLPSPTPAPTKNDPSEATPQPQATSPTTSPVTAGTMGPSNLVDDSKNVVVLAVVIPVLCFILACIVGYWRRSATAPEACTTEQPDLEPSTENRVV